MGARMLSEDFRKKFLQKKKKEYGDPDYKITEYTYKKNKCYNSNKK